MSYQIKRSNRSVVVVERWYVDGIQKERHVMTIEPYTTSERLHELQDEFRDSKGKIPKKKYKERKIPKKIYKERKDRIVRLSESDIEVIEDSLQVTKKRQYEDIDKEKHKAVTKRITETPTTTKGKMSERAWVMKYGSEELKKKRYNVFMTLLYVKHLHGHSGLWYMFITLDNK
jgi:replicative superfamily II helicase